MYLLRWLVFGGGGPGSMLAKAIFGVLVLVFAVLPVGLGLTYPHRALLVAVISGSCWVVLGLLVTLRTNDRGPRRRAVDLEGVFMVAFFVAIGLFFLWVARWGAVASDLQAEGRLGDALLGFDIDESLWDSRERTTARGERYTAYSAGEEADDLIDEAIRDRYRIGMIWTIILGVVAAGLVILFNYWQRPTATAMASAPQAQSAPASGPHSEAPAASDLDSEARYGELDRLLPGVRTDDAQRQRFVQVLGELDDSDPKKADYRRRLASALY